VTEQKEHAAAVAQFRTSLKKVVDLGYGNDECEAVVVMMFEDLVRQSIPCTERDQLSFTLPLKLPEGENTHNHLFELVTELENLADSEKVAEARMREGRCFLFPFLTTLGIAGGVFMLTVHVTRLIPTLFGSAGGS
jgi:hypothetical protein